MFDVDYAFDQLNWYGGLEYKLDELARRIDCVINNLQAAENNINCLLINGERLDKRKITNIKDELATYKRYLLTTCKSSASQCKQAKVQEIESNGITIIWG